MFRLSTISGSGKTGRIVIILLTVVLLTLLGFVHFKWWPWLINKTVTAQYGETFQSEMRLFSTIMENFHRVYYPHSKQLLSYEEDNIPLDSIDLSELTALPGVNDAFWVDFEQGKAASAENSISNDTLIRILDRSKNRYAPGGGAAQIMRRTVGGLTRFWSYKIAGKRYAMLLRYQNTFYPERGTQVIGLILNVDWFTAQVPSLLDSLVRENPVILFMAPQPPDTAWREVSDPYRAPNNEWKQTMGVLKGQDTLWWYGDPNVSIHEGPLKKGEDPGYFVRVAPFNLDVLVNTEFPEESKSISDGRIAVTRLFTILEILGILLIIVLAISIYSTTRQASRNRIALAHLAHSIKTPVARIRLDTDSLLEEMVASPVEEREIVTAIGRECGRMERAVQSAALSLEEGKRTLNLESCDLAQIVSDTTLAWQTQFDQAGIELRIDEADVPMQGRFDREMIAVMIDNLLDNALRHTALNMEKTQHQSIVTRQTGMSAPPGGLNKENIKKDDAAVTVRLRKIDGKGEIVVDDMGGGIPAAERRHIFKRFRRVRGDAASGVSGLGLGLALVKEIAEAHGGKVHVTDNDSGGARFVVELVIS